MSSVAWKTYFKDCWLINDEYSPWIKKCYNDEFAFYCKKVMLSNIGEKAVKNHMSRDSHKNALKRVKNTISINSFFIWAANQFPASLTLLLCLLMLKLFGYWPWHKRIFQQIPVMAWVKFSKQCFLIAIFIATSPGEQTNAPMSSIVDLILFSRSN